jgi:hypothetical protein
MTLPPPVRGGGDDVVVVVVDVEPCGCECEVEVDMDRDWEDGEVELYDPLLGDGCVCLLGWGGAEREGGCWRKAARKEDRKKGRCEVGMLVVGWL